MKSFWEKNSCGGRALGLCLAALLGACATEPVAPQPVTHVVLMWLKHPERASDRAQLTRAAQSLRLMPGVTGVKTGRSVAVAPAEADRDFDLAVAITFRDRVALERYERDPRHTGAMQRYLQPLLRRYVVYNPSDR